MTSPRPPSRAGRPDPLDVGEIVAHQGFLRSLARGLVVDRGGADDLVQETYLHVLERAPPRPLRLKAWLARVVTNLARDRHRGAERREARELVPPAATAPASTHELVERMELHRRLVELVLALDESYRAVLLLHHFEGLTVAQTAQRLGLPLETARTRLRRALAMLRERLDRELGGRDATLEALLPIARMALPHAAPSLPAAASATAAAGALVGVPLVMTTGTKLTLAAASALVFGGVLLLATREADLDPRPPVIAGVRHAETPAPAQLEVRDPGAASVDAERAAAPAPTSATTGLEPLLPGFGTLRVRTVWQRDGRAAAHLHVRLTPLDRDDAFPLTRRARTDERGELLLRDVEPAQLAVAAAGFSDEDDDAESEAGASGAKEVVVKAGAVSEVVLEIPDALSVRGEVVDESDRPVPGAEIWLSDRKDTFSDGTFVTTADERGRFEIAAVERMHYFAARAPGRSMSEQTAATTFSASSEVTLRLVIGPPGATLRGRVVDRDGAAIAGALVVVDGGTQGSRLLGNGQIQADAPPRTTRTANDGSFELDALPSGAVQVGGTADGCAPSAIEHDLRAGAMNELEIVLSPGGRVHGRVLDAGGAPVADVAVTAIMSLGSRLFRMGFLETRSDAEGTFELERLAPGVVSIRIDAKELGKLQLPVTVAEGETLRRDFTLARGLELRGRVLDQHGAPIAQAKVEVDPIGPSPAPIPTAQTTDGEGRFTIPGCAEIDYELHVFHPELPFFAALTLAPIRAGGEELAIEIDAAHRPSATITGTLLDPDGRPAQGAVVQAHRLGGRSVIGVPCDAEGEFRLGTFTPGSYFVSTSAEGYAEISFPRIELAPDQHLDLGELRFARPATIVVRATRADGGSVPASALRLRKLDGGESAALAPSGSELRASGLLPGEWRLDVEGDGLAQRRIPVTGRAGETTTVELRLEPGVERRFTIARADGGALAAPLTWIASDASGEELHGTLEVAPGATSASLSLFLAVGDWSIELTAADGARAESSFDVSARRSDDEPISITVHG